MTNEEAITIINLARDMAALAVRDYAHSPMTFSEIYVEDHAPEGLEDEEFEVRYALWEKTFEEVATAIDSM